MGDYRASHVTGEVLMSEAPGALRTSSVWGEAIAGPDSAETRSSQLIGEVLLGRAPLAPPEFDVRMYGPDGKRKYLPLNWITEINFELLERGGCGQGGLRILAEWENQSGIVGNERIDVWLFSELIYRGWIRIAERQIGLPEAASPTLYGLVETLDKLRIRRKYAYGSSTDVATVFGQMMTDHYGIYNPSAIIEASSGLGGYVTEFDARGKSLAQAANMLMDLAPNRGIWGAEVDMTTYDLVDRIYCRPRSSTVTHAYAIGANVEGFVLPKDTGGIVNRLLVTGGAVDVPNVCPNPSFEEPLPNSETVNNLVDDYSFETGTGWSASGGASRKYVGQDVTAVGAPRTGKYWLELDNSGEAYYRTFPIDYREAYMAHGWARREVVGTGTAVRMKVEALDSASVVQATYTGPWTTPAGAVYEKFYAKTDNSPLVFSSWPNTTQLRVTVETNGGTGSNDGVLVDDVTVFIDGGVGQSAWEHSIHGNAQILVLDWVNKRNKITAGEDFEASHGGYRLRWDATQVFASTDYLEIRTTEAERFEVMPNETYAIAFRYRFDGSQPDIRIGFAEFAADGTANNSTEGDAPSGGTADTWNWSPVLSVLTESDSETAEVFIRNRSTEEVYVDAVWVSRGAIPQDVFDNGDYWPGETYERIIDVEDSGISLDASAQTSIDDWGEREIEVTEDTVTDLAILRAFATGYFNAHAVPEYDGQLSIKGAEANLTLDGSVRLVNLDADDDPPALFPARVQYSVMGDSVDIRADLGGERPDASNLALFLKRQSDIGG